MTLKEKLARSRRIADIKHEIETYQAAIDGGSKFTLYYAGKVMVLEDELKAI